MSRSKSKSQMGGKYAIVGAEASADFSEGCGYKLLNDNNLNNHIFPIRRLMEQLIKTIKMFGYNEAMVFWAIGFKFEPQYLEYSR